MMGDGRRSFGYSNDNLDNRSANFRFILDAEISPVTRIVNLKSGLVKAIKSSIHFTRFLCLLIYILTVLKCFFFTESN